MPLSAIAARKLALEKQAAQNIQKAASAPTVETQIKPSASTHAATSNAAASEPTNKPTKKRKRKQPQSQEPKKAHGQETRPVLEAEIHAKPPRETATLVPGSDVSLDGAETSGSGNPTRPSLEKSGYKSLMITNETSDDDFSELGPDDPVSQTPRYISVSLSSVRKQSVKMKRIDGIRSAVVRLVPGERVVAVGEYDLWVRKGTVTVYGAVLHASPKLYRIHAASSHALPVILGVQNPYGGDPAAEVALFSHQSGMRRLKSINPGFLALWNDAEKSRHCTFRILWSSGEDELQRPLQPFNETNAWKLLATTLIASEGSRPPVMLVCGPKGTGKSTLNRFLTNAFLCSQKYRGMAYLDIDPGQPEYRPPGDLSLCFLKEYNFGPSYAHPDCIDGENAASRVHHFGFMTPRDDTESYLSCVLDLHKTYQQLYSDCPLLVNCSGWILGSGIECLESLLSSIRPTETIYMSKEGPEEVLEVLDAGTRRIKSRLHTLASASGDRMQRTSADLRSMQTLSYFHARSVEEGHFHWDATPIDEMEQRKWHYSGELQFVDAMCPYHDELNPDVFNYLVDMSIYAVVAVDGDEQLQQELELDSERQQAQATREENTWNEQPLEPDHNSQDQMVNDPGSLAIGTVKRALRRTKEGFPYYCPGSGAYKPFDPAKSQTLGQLLIRSYDVEEKCLQVVTPVPAALIEEHRARGSAIVLVRGKLDRPEWAFLEPYYIGLWREQEYEKWKARYDALPAEYKVADAGASAEDDTMSFDVEAWAAKTPWVSAIKQDDFEYRRRQKVWRVRRNLETSDSKKQ